MQVLKKLSFLYILTFLLACNNTPAFVGSWELVSIELADGKITGSELGNPVYTFNEDKSYTIEYTELLQSGTWEMEGESLYLRDKQRPDEVNTLTIILAEKTIFNYTIGDGDTKTNVILKRAD